jgi:hypothetical protein
VLPPSSNELVLYHQRSRVVTLLSSEDSLLLSELDALERVSSGDARGGIDSLAELSLSEELSASLGRRGEGNDLLSSLLDSFKNADGIQKSIAGGGTLFDDASLSHLAGILSLMLCNEKLKKDSDNLCHKHLIQCSWPGSFDRLLPGSVLMRQVLSGWCSNIMELRFSLCALCSMCLACQDSFLKKSSILLLIASD